MQFISQPLLENILKQITSYSTKQIILTFEKINNYDLLQLLPTDIEKIICDYANDVYDIECEMMFKYIDRDICNFIQLRLCSIIDIIFTFTIQIIMTDNNNFIKIFLKHDSDCIIGDSYFNYIFLFETYDESKNIYQYGDSIIQVTNTKKMKIIQSMFNMITNVIIKYYESNHNSICS